MRWVVLGSRSTETCAPRDSASRHKMCCSGKLSFVGMTPENVRVQPANTLLFISEMIVDTGEVRASSCR